MLVVVVVFVWLIYYYRFCIFGVGCCCVCFFWKKVDVCFLEKFTFMVGAFGRLFLLFIIVFFEFVFFILGIVCVLKLYGN